MRISDWSSDVCSSDLVIDLCDRAVLLDHGELLARGTPRNIVSRYQKLLYAPADAVERIRAQIREDDAEGHGLQVDEAPAATRASPGARPADASPLPAARWEDGPGPTRTVEYAHLGPTSRDPKVQSDLAYRGSTNGRGDGRRGSGR